MTGIIDKVKDALHKDKDHSSSTTHSTTGTSHSTTAGTSGYPSTGTKVADIDHKTGHGTTGTTGGLTGSSNTHGSTNAGPHQSNLANKADPRVDSDLDSSRNTGYGSSTTGGGVTGGYTGAGTGIHGTSGSTNAGPHQSNLANKADPRVDSDLDSSRNTGYGSSTTGGTTGYGSSNTHGTTGTGYGSSTTGSSNTAGPHNSNIANKLDPRVDSDRDGSRNAGAASGTTGYGSNTHGTTGGYSGTHAGNSGLTGNTGTHGGISSSNNAGPHDSNLANKADPRVDSDLDGKGNRHGANTGGVFGASGSHATAGSGTAQNTAGPHNSDMLNKLDPRVDSDRDGSKTYGGNATRQ